MSQSSETSNAKYISLKNFFIFNSTYGTKEGEEKNKILFYYPYELEIDSKIKDVGLCEAIIKFTNTFTSDESVHCLRTQKTLQIYFQPEKNFWFIMTINVPSERKTREGVEYNDYKGEDVHENVFQQVLKQSYFMFRLFNGTIEMNFIADSIEEQRKHLIGKMEQFFLKYVLSLKLRNCDILDIFRSIQYLPVNKFQFLRVHNFIQMIESTFPTIKYCTFLYNEQLVWSGINPNDLYSVYEYLVGTLFPKNSKDELLRGGSLTRSQRSYSNCVDSHYGAFLTGPEFLSDNCKRAPKVFIFNDNQCQCYKMIVYNALSATLCLFVEDDAHLNEEFYDELHIFIGPQLTNIASDIGEQFIKEQSSNSGSSQNDDSGNNVKYLFFNELNCQHNGTVHLNQKMLKKKSNLPRDVMNLLNDLYVQDAVKLSSGEVIVKTMNDYWIVKRASNWRHLFIVFNKPSTLLEIADDANKFFEQNANNVSMTV